MKKACIFCASSEKASPYYMAEARQLGERLVSEGWGIVYGGGSTGLMGAVADGVLDCGGSVTGVIPHFMVEVEWQHKGVADMRLTDDMSERKQMMIRLSDAIVVLPGSTGTMDELFEAASDKKLGLHQKPIVILNSRGFFDHTFAQLKLMVDENLMTNRHLDVITEAKTIDDVIVAINAPAAEPIKLTDAQVKK